jgi:hypothetical protein
MTTFAQRMIGQRPRNDGRTGTASGCHQTPLPPRALHRRPLDIVAPLQDQRGSLQSRCPGELDQ